MAAAPRGGGVLTKAGCGCVGRGKVEELAGPLDPGLTAECMAMTNLQLVVTPHDADAVHDPPPTLHDDDVVGANDHALVRLHDGAGCGADRDDTGGAVAGEEAGLCEGHVEGLAFTIQREGAEEGAEGC